MRVYRKKITLYSDPDGRRVKAGEATVADADGKRRLRPGFARDVRKTEKHYGRVRDHLGLRREVPLCRDKTAAETLLREMQRKADRRRSGDVSAFDDHAKRPLLEHLADYRRYLASKGSEAEHVEQTESRIRAIADGCGFKFIRDVSASRLAAWLADARQCRHSGKTSPAEGVRGIAKTYGQIAKAFGVGESTVTYWRRQGAPIVPRKRNDLAAIARWKAERDTREGLSIATSNAYLTAAKGFCRWLVRERRAAENPLSHLSALNAKPDIRRERRALEPGELARLLDKARAGEACCGLTGEARAMLYLTAAATGLRASELASLTASSFDLTADPPTVTVEAAYSKHRRRDELPIRADLAERLAAFLDAQGRRTRDEAADVLRFDRRGERSPQAKLWPGSWIDTPAAMLRVDLKAAGIPYRDEAGRYFDFHALRHHFITWLAQSGVHPKDAQALARHSTITLTMDRYSHTGIRDMNAALAKLPELPGGQGEAARATGTDDFVSPLFRQNASKTGIGGRQEFPIADAGGAAKAAKNPVKSAAFTGFTASEADGARTRNHRIDSPVL